MNWFLRLNPHCDLNSYSASVEATVVVPHSTFMDTIIVALCYHISHTIAATATLQYFSKVLGIRYSFYFSFHDKRGRRYECEKASHCSQPQYYTPTQAILQSVGQWGAAEWNGLNKWRTKLGCVVITETESCRLCLLNFILFHCWDVAKLHDCCWATPRICNRNVFPLALTFYVYPILLS